MTKFFPLSSSGFNPFGEMIGLEFTSVGDGESRCELEVCEGLLNPHGVLHGAAMYAMADTGMGGALYSRLDEGELCTTIEVSIYYFRPVTGGTVECETKVVHRGRRVATLSSEIRSCGETIARATGTFYIYRPGGADPR